ncbi:MAG TPA: histidine kinase, partial [Verrucomicrobiae bacterium]|nr:histidine kinase [Verrucomicrobiae bacterium]
MNSRARQLSRQYAAALCRYLKRPQETHLQQAYELGREASARGLGVLDVARVHQSALASCLSPTQSAAEKARTLRAAETLFMETLSPFEAMHRGFRDANLELQQLNAQLKRRNAELRASEDHFHQLFEQARVMQENLRALSTKILHVQEEERKHISRELHDEVGQSLTAINTNLTMLQRNGTVDSALLKKKIADTQSLLEQTMETVHRFARELRPAMLDELGLLPAL